MELKLKNKKVNVICTSYDINGKETNLSKLSAQDLLDILEELTKDFKQYQSNIESVLYNRTDDGNVLWDGVLKPWTEHIKDIATS